MSPELSRLLAQMRPQRARVALAVLLLVATIAASMGLIATSGWLLSRAALHPSIAALGVAVVGVRFFGLARGGLRYLERLASHDVTLRLLSRLRVVVYRALEPLAPARLAEARRGDLLGRLVADVETLENAYIRVLGPAFAALGVAAFAGALLIPRGPWLAAAALLGLALAGLLLPSLVERAGRAPGERLIARRALLEARLVDGVQGVADLLVYGRARDHVAAVETASREVADEQLRLASTGGLGSAVGTLTADLSALAVLALAIPLVRSGALAGEQLAVVALLTLASFEAVVGLSGATQVLGTTRAAARRLFQLLDATPAVVDPPSAAAAGPGEALQVSNLSFSYPGAVTPALDGVSLRLARGRLVALVGASGSGKSTLAQLLLRFWDIAPGQILLDGHDVRALAADAVRARIACASQGAQVFTGSIRDNLRLARPDADDAACAQALREAGLDIFVAGLPEGEATWIGEQGIRLSGGERQRLALAQAFLKEAPILLLDEPTAHLDAVAEAALLVTILARRSQAVLLITHRLAGLEQVDEIVVLEAGRIVERGTLAELEESGGAFTRMAAAQRAASAVESLSD